MLPDTYRWTHTGGPVLPDTHRWTHTGGPIQVDPYRWTLSCPVCPVLAVRAVRTVLAGFQQFRCFGGWQKLHFLGLFADRLLQLFKGAHLNLADPFTADAEF